MVALAGADAVLAGAEDVSGVVAERAVAASAGGGLPGSALLLLGLLVALFGGEA